MRKSHCDKSWDKKLRKRAGNTWLTGMIEPGFAGYPREEKDGSITMVAVSGYKSVTVNAADRFTEPVIIHSPRFS